MERFLVGAAIFAAVVIAAGGYFGSRGGLEGVGIHIDIDDEQPAVAKGAPQTLAETVYAGVKVKVVDAAAIVEIIPETRTDIAVSIVNSGRIGTPTVRLDKDVVVIDGGLRGASRRCSGDGGAFSVAAGASGDVGENELPRIVIRSPMAVEGDLEGGLKVSVGPSDQAALQIAGCGEADIGDVRGAGRIGLSGATDATIGALGGGGGVRSAGAGDVMLGAVRGQLDLSVAGSGDIIVSSLDGDLDAQIAGSGDIRIEAGAVTKAKAAIAGSGNVAIAGDVGALEASIAGSGDVLVEGSAAEVDASIMGSGDVEVARTTGRVRQSSLGSGRVRVGE